mmetsp:Transcript_20454/g.41928  ORF Transcript_20454/g.41928 Transcript_20454/m.41928 type:complete len:221 (-) Transcript_20454:817-1479(-)
MGDTWNTPSKPCSRTSIFRQRKCWRSWKICRPRGWAAATTAEAANRPIDDASSTPTKNWPGNWPRKKSSSSNININININAGPPPRIPRGVLIPLTPPEDPPILPEEAAEEDRDWEKPSATCSAALRREAPPFRANGVPPSRNSRGRLPRLARRIALPARGFLLPMPFRRRLRIPRQRKGEERPPSSRTISSASRGGNIPPLPLRVRMPHRRRRLPMERR